MIGPLTGQTSPAADGVERRPTCAVLCLGGANPRGDVVRRRLQRVDLPRLRLLGGRQLREIGELLLLRRREIVRGPRQLVLHVPCLGCPRRDDRRLPLDGCAELLRLRARSGHLELGVSNLSGDPSILFADLVQVLHLVECVLNRTGAEHDVERRGGLGLIDVDESPVQGLDRRGVLLLQEVQPLGLEAEERAEGVEPALMQRDVGL